MIEFLFLDLDDTILDFHQAEAIAVAKTIRDFGVEPTPEVLERYHEINRWHWEQLEQGKLTRDQVLVNRFSALFSELGRQADPVKCARSYDLASNGTATVQHSRLTSANLYRFFEQVFISQEVGFNKPAREFFESCFARIPGFSRERAMMVGDSLSSDIQGGIPTSRAASTPELPQYGSIPGENSPGR